MEELGKKVASMASRVEEAQRVCSSEAEYEGWTRAFVSDLVKTTMPEYICDIRNRADPQEERKEELAFKQELDEISTHMDEFFIEFENEVNS
jgi:hypothetical protein